MSEINYEKLKFKSGLEIHQQLDANGRKLFCDCPSVLRKDEPDFSVERKLHAVAGQSGEVDIAAEYQISLGKTFVYQGHKENSCLVEFDEEPPHKINSEALRTALQIALLLNCKIIPVTQIMRKTVVDGSNTSGFQRTVLIARDGYVETSLGRVGIESVCLEEDSARKVKSEEDTPSGAYPKGHEPRNISNEMSTGGKIYWSLDRLGIPLVEIATAPDIKNSEQAKEAALKIGDVLRSCKVKRGLGTVRQDVNISILDEKRIEMKGVQDMKMFVKIIENEVLRQKELHDKGNPTKAEVRNALTDGTSEFLRPMPGADRMYPETDLSLLKISRDLINEIKKTLPKLRSDVAGELKEKGLSEEMTKLLLKANKIDEFEDLLEVYGKVNFVAKMMLLFPKEISSKVGKSFEEIEDILGDYYGDVLRAVKEDKIHESDVKNVLLEIVLGKKFEDSINIEKKDMGDVEERILKIIKSKPGLNAKAYMGLVMKEFRGQVNGKEAMDVIDKLIK